jgi:predicted metal-dependent hydrolase
MQPLRQLFLGRKSAAPLPPLQPIVILLEDRSISIAVKRHATARRMVLRLARDGESFTLTVPKRQSATSAKAFVEQSRTWLANTLAHRGRKAEGENNTLMLRGQRVSLQSTGKLRGLVQYDEVQQTLLVPGGEAHMKRRLIEWLKREAEQDLRTVSQRYAEKMGCRFTKLTVRDQQSRWGSCTADGALSYSWRLILAPAFVLDYVAAHEVAHLKEMNHSSRFWRLVLTHCPCTRDAKRWLKANGHTLHHALS